MRCLRERPEKAFSSFIPPDNLLIPKMPEHVDLAVREKVTELVTLFLRVEKHQIEQAAHTFGEMSTPSGKLPSMIT